MSESIVPGDVHIGHQVRKFEQPQHWNSRWRQFPVHRKTATQARRPIETLERWPAYWRGYQLPWETWTDTVDRQELDVAFMPWLNDVVILDCDVKRYVGELVAHKDNPNLVTAAPAVIKHGVDDLARMAESRGHTMDELETYTVRTQSGGFHLYFDVGEREMRTRHHRDEWRIDVIATPHNWVAAPPTPGYEVVRDVPVVRMPEWLHDVVTCINDLRPPVGGRKRRQLDGRVRGLRASVASPGCDRGLFRDWLRAQCELIELSNQVGAWNSTIFEVACDFFSVGLQRSLVERLILDAAEPWDSRQRRSVIATVTSAQSYKMRSGS